MLTGQYCTLELGSPSRPAVHRLIRADQGGITRGGTCIALAGDRPKLTRHRVRYKMNIVWSVSL
jgi:hypothetical protein